ncbi:phosphate ABC transporter permease PtsA, partial [Pantoea agglomerans]|nr:phosphate ABC transporter permease PtsA [Pantoea agglomerans]
MTTIEIQARAELDASRRKMQSWRSTKNKIALTLSLLTI